MKDIKNFIINEKREQSVSTEKLSKEFIEFIAKYAKYYNYDAIKLVCMINLELRDLLRNDNSYSIKLNGATQALKTFNKEFEKYQSIAI